MKKVEIDVNEMIRLNNEHLTPEEIGVKLGVSGSSIRRRLKQLGIDNYRKISKKSDDLLNKIEDLIKKGKTNKQIAELLSMSPTTVRKYTKELGYETNSQRTKTLTNKEIELNTEQLEVLYGSLLGDMSIDTNWKHARPIISQGGLQEEYFDHKCKIFENLIGKISKKDRYDKRTNKWYHRYYVKFLTNPIYTKLKEELYPNGIKTITLNWLNKLTARSLAFWFMDDGTNSGVLATNCFTYEECLLIQKWFSEKWNINTTIQSQKNKGGIQYLIYIIAESKPIFYDLVFPYFIPSMLYKIKNWNPKSCELRETPQSLNY